MHNRTTLYGMARKGGSRFIVVAPHGPDDLFTAELAEKLAASLDASLLANTEFVKPTNPAASENPSKVWDFNRLPWYADSGSYVRNIECEGLRHFVRDLLGYTRSVSVEGNLRPVVVYVHGMKDRPGLGIDIGIGVRLRNNGLLSAKEYAETFLSPENTAPGGSVISDVRKALRLRQYWQSILREERNLDVGIWDVYFTGRPEQLPQIHRHLGYDADSLQIEICRSLRWEIEYVSDVLRSGLLDVYS